jgi:polyisoprenoid-binding protein YceI
LVAPGKAPSISRTFTRSTVMRHFVTAILLGTLLVSGTAFAGGTFPLTAKNTKIEFIGTKPQGKHVGGFETVTGTAKAGADATTLKVEVEIDTNSLYSDTPKLTQHLKSSDFFAVKDHPKAKFVSSKVEKAEDGYKITGDLTMLGKTKTITFPATIKSSDDSLTVTSEFKINRQDFGMSFGKGKVDDEVTIKVSLKATK